MKRRAVVLAFALLFASGFATDFGFATGTGDFAVGGLPSGPLQAAPKSNFSFLKATGLRQGDDFRIFAKTPGLFGTSLSQVGTGKVHVLSAREMRISFAVSILTRKISGDVRLKYKTKRGKDLLFELVYSGKENARPESSRETVKVDAFLGGRGIVAFHYHKARRFLQISRSSSGQNKFVTDWGAATLRK